jgi:methyltransferase
MILDGSVPIALAILLYVTGQRLLELVVASRNTRRLLGEGAFEVGASHYKLIVALHAAWLLTIWVLAPGRPIHLVPLLLFALVQILRFWTLASIGRRWTTRIIVKPGEQLVAKGPYRFVSHPNYLVVVLEILLLPSVFGLYAVAVLFSLLNAAALLIRIPAEASALRRHQAPAMHGAPLHAKDRPSA